MSGSRWRCLAGFLLLHDPQGNEILVNPKQVTSLRPRSEGKNFADGLYCMVNLADGKYVAVVEHCDAIQSTIEQMLEQER